jgi:uncharacterized SAM-binding protein YcdF (DUF218 family)
LAQGMSFEWMACLLTGYAICVAVFSRKIILKRTAVLWKRIVLTLTVWTLVTAAGFFILIQSMIYFAGTFETDPAISTILVPGAGIIRTEPSFTLSKRLDTAFEYLDAHPESIVILSGGKSHGQLASEAQVMQWYLERLGIESDRILKEEYASNTMENIHLSKKMYEEKKKQPLREIMLITSDYHLLRTKMIARRAGLRAYGLRSVSPPGLYQEYAVREFFAIFKSMFFDW